MLSPGLSMVQPEGDQRPENDEGFNVTESKAAGTPTWHPRPAGLAQINAMWPHQDTAERSNRHVHAMLAQQVHPMLLGTTCPRPMRSAFRSTASHPVDGPLVPSTGGSTVAKRCPSWWLMDHAPSLLVSERTVAWSKKRAKGRRAQTKRRPPPPRYGLTSRRQVVPTSSSHPAQAAGVSTRVVRPIHVPKPNSNRVNPATSHQRPRLQKEGAGQGVGGTEEVAMRRDGQFVGCRR